MKCEECGGTGKVQKWFYERTGFGKYEKVCGDVKCEWCNGTGEVEQTEQEYIQACNTEQLAEWFANHGFLTCPLRNCDDCIYYDKKNDDCYDVTDHKQMWVEWLKKPYQRGDTE